MLLEESESEEGSAFECLRFLQSASAASRPAAVERTMFILVLLVTKDNMQIKRPGS